MSDDKHIDIADDLSKCSACGLPISGVYASFGGNWVPYVRPQLYHMKCVPSLADMLARGLSDGTGTSVPDGTGHSI